MQQWHMNKGSLMRYDSMDIAAPLVLITDAWPAPGVQRFYVRLYPDGRSRDEAAVVNYDYRDNFAEAVALAEEWTPQRVSS